MMHRTRRQVLQAGSLAASASLLGGCDKRVDTAMPVPYQLGKPLPWVNWSANQYCFPKNRVAPETEAEVVDTLRAASGVVRAVGSGHSFSALVPTDHTLVATDFLSGLVSHDAATLEAEVWAGTRLHDLGPLLASNGLQIAALPDIDYPAIGGAIATSAHGAGGTFGSLSSYVTGLTLATPKGDLLTCSAAENPALFQAARVSLGALGIATRVRLQLEKLSDLTEVNGIAKTEDILAQLDTHFDGHRNFEFLPLPHTRLCLTVATDPAKPGDREAGDDDPKAIYQLRDVFDAVSWLPWAPQIYGRIIDLMGSVTSPIVHTGPAYSILTHPRLFRFREMEYTVPVEAGEPCIREILRTIEERRLPICFPIECRQVAADDIYLSMFERRRGFAISLHQFADLDFKPYFDAIEPIFWKYEGRPHWGKLHTLDAKRLAALYPKHWQDFCDIRRHIDPAGKMLNAHLRSLFGDEA